VHYKLRCLSCNKEYPEFFRKQLCDFCHGILEIVYLGKPAVRELRKDFWSYEPLLPHGRYKRYKLGNTTLLKSAEENLFLKLETENPTKSFKDRGSVVEIAKALEYGYDEVVCASTGNMAYSVAYYAKLGGIRSTIFVSKNANWLKIRNIRETRDADIHKVNGDFTEAQRRAIGYAKRKGAFLVGDYGYRKEGQKTLINEILAELPGVRNVLIPVGNATLFSASYKGLMELQGCGLVGASPRLIAVQAALTDPLAVAFKTGNPVKYQEPLTDAGAIAVGFPTYGDQAIKAIRETKGAVIEVSDAEMEEERKSFFREYGLQVEMSGVASMAAYRNVSLKGKTVAVISGANTLKP
jgi:threonine synthase